MFGNRLAASEFHPEVSVIGEIEKSISGNIVLRVGRIWTDDPERGWQQTEHVVLVPNEVPVFLRNVVEVMDPPRSKTLTLKLDRETAKELYAMVEAHLDGPVYAENADRNAEPLSRLYDQLAEFINAP